METLSVGKEIVCYCTRCKMDLGHTIMAMAGGLPARVICRTCKSEHAFRGKKGLKEPLKEGEAPPRASSGTTARKTVPQSKSVPVEEEWSKQMNSNSTPIKPYSAVESFKIGDKVSHPTFGPGVVQKLLYPNKLEILFQMDLKTLVHKP